MAGDTKICYNPHFYQKADATDLRERLFSVERRLFYQPFVQDDQIFYKWVFNTYLEKTDYPKDKLSALMEHEGGFVYAKDCLKYKLVDYIID